MTDYRYYQISPRGFANEVTYIRVPIADIPEVESHFAGRKDREFDRGNTHWSSGWTNSRRASRPGVAIEWADYIATY